MIIFAHSKCKRYENRKIQGVALPKKERNGQEWKSSHHGTHHGEQDYVEKPLNFAPFGHAELSLLAKI